MKARAHRWIQTLRGMECKHCHIRAAWPGARYGCSGLGLNDAQNERRKLARSARERP